MPRLRTETNRYSIYIVFWQLYIVDLRTTFAGLTAASAVGLAGTALGCIFLIPCAIKYGRRPVYIISLAVMSACAAWQAKMTSIGEMYAIMMISGLAGATNETIVQMTVCYSSLLTGTHHRQLILFKKDRGYVLRPPERNRQRPIYGYGHDRGMSSRLIDTPFYGSALT